MKTGTAASNKIRPGLILALISLPVFIGALDLTIVSAVLPNVIVDLRLPFQTGADDAAWVVSGYLLAYTVSVAVMGRISDLMGRRRTYFLALLLFILGSWLVAVATFAPTEWMRSLFRLFQGGRPDSAYMALYALIAGRFIQALGAGAMVPVSMALVADLFPAGKRALPLGIVGAVDTAGWVLGHLYGGLMVQIIDWPVLFWINVPVTTLVAVLTWRQLAPTAEARDEGGNNRITWGVIALGAALVNIWAIVAMIHAFVPSALGSLEAWLLDQHTGTLILCLLLLAGIILTLISARRLNEDHKADWPGVALLSLTLVGLNIGLGGGAEVAPGEQLSGTPPLSPQSIYVLLITALVFAGFLVVERRSQHPLFSLSYFRKRNISLSISVNLLVGFCLMVGLVSVPLFINAIVAETLDEAALVSGLLLGTLTIPMALASIPGGLLTQRFGYRIPTVAGLALAAVGFFLARTWPSDVSQLTMGLHMGLAGIGLGLTVSPIGTAVINAVKSGERGTASALVLIMRLIGMTIGTSAMTTYGLRRSTILTEELVAAAGTPSLAEMVDIVTQSTTLVINEMMLIAAVVCLVGLVPALWLRPGDEESD